MSRRPLGRSASRSRAAAPGAKGKDAKAYVWPDHAVPFAFAYDAAQQRLSLSVDGVTSAHTGLAARSARGEPARSLWLRLQGGNNRSSVELTGLFLTTAGGTEALDDVQARAATGELAMAGLDATQDWVLEGQIRFADADELTAAFSLTDLAAQHVLTSLP